MQPTNDQIAYLGNIWGISRDWEILERAGRVLGIKPAHVRKGRITAGQIEDVIARALAKRGLTDTRKPASDFGW